MKNFKFYLAGSLVILFLLFFQFVFVVLKEATILDRAQKEWDPSNIELRDLGFTSDRFVKDKNIRKEVIKYNNKKFLVVFMGNEQSYFDRKIVANMFVYGPDISGKTVLKDFQSFTLTPKEEPFFKDNLPELPFVEKVVDINGDGVPEILVNLGNYPGLGARYTVVSYDLIREDLKWLRVQDKNGIIDQAWFFEGYFDDAILRFEIDEKESSVYQFIGVMPRDISEEESLDLNNWNWRVDIFTLAREGGLFIQK